MTSSSPPPFRTVSFGASDGASWGTALDAGLPAIVYGAAGLTGSAAGPEALRWSEPDEANWRLAGDGFELLVAPVVGELVVVPAADGPERPDTDAVLDELCHVSGTLLIGGTEHAIDCAGTRSVGGGLDPHAVGSVRGVCAWFDSDHAVSLLAFRPRGSADQENERLAATVFEPEGAIWVDEPRLSTTYAAAGRPTRASLELWIGEGEEQFPRRAAAEALDGGGELDVDGLQLQVTPLRCHSRGLDGAGLYMLARL